MFNLFKDFIFDNVLVLEEIQEVYHAYVWSFGMVLVFFSIFIALFGIYQLVLYSFVFVSRLFIRA